MKALIAVLALSLLGGVYFVGARDGARQAYQQLPPQRVRHEYVARCVTEKVTRPHNKRM